MKKSTYPKRLTAKNPKGSKKKELLIAIKKSNENYLPKVAHSEESKKI